MSNELTGVMVRRESVCARARERENSYQTSEIFTLLTRIIALTE